MENLLSKNIMWQINQWVGGIFQNVTKKQHTRVTYLKKSGTIFLSRNLVKLLELIKLVLT